MLLRPTGSRVLSVEDLLGGLEGGPSLPCLAAVARGVQVNSQPREADITVTLGGNNRTNSIPDSKSYASL